MSCLRLCDSNDCYQSENDSPIFHIDYETSEFLKEHLGYWMNGSCDDICKDCIENTNIDYPEFFTIDEMQNLTIGEKYLSSPELAK